MEDSIYAFFQELYLSLSLFRVTLLCLTLIEEQLRLRHHRQSLFFRPSLICSSLRLSLYIYISLIISMRAIYPSLVKERHTYKLKNTNINRIHTKLWRLLILVPTAPPPPPRPMEEHPDNPSSSSSSFVKRFPPLPLPQILQHALDLHTSR